VDQTAIFRHARELQQATTLDDLMRVTEQAVAAISRYRQTWLVLRDSDPSIVRLIAASQDLKPLAFERSPIIPVTGDPMVEEILTAHHVVVVEDARTDPRTNKATVARMQNRTIINVPLCIGERLVGALGIGTYGGEGVLPPTQEELDALVVYAMQLAAAWERVHLSEERLRAEHERHALQQRLEAVQRLEMMGVLTSGVAHDLNNLLMVVIANLESLDTPMAAETRATVDDALAAGRRARDVAKQLLVLGREPTARRETLDLAARVAATVELIRAAVPRGVTVRQSVVANPAIEGDPVQIDQALANLLLNARDAIGDRGEIVTTVDAVDFDEAACRRLRWAHVGHYARVEVHDNGSGVPPELIGRVFEPLFTTKPHGTGLGLAVVSQVVERHHGFVRCESELGRGTSFEVYFPTK